jgi:predicted nucleic acid-binding protein
VIVVSDASPLISLAAIGRLDLLRQFFGTLTIPAFVHEEVTRAAGRAGAGELASSDWVVVRKLGNEFLARALDGELDRGEAEAIALAVELKADLVLIDERRGRAVAARFGLRVVGVLGLLVEAKRKGLLDRVEPVLSDLLHKAGFRLGPELYRRILEEAGEASSLQI